MPVVRLTTRRARLDEDVLARLHDTVAEAGAPEDVTLRLLTVIERALSARSGWRFVMVDPHLFLDVVRHLTDRKGSDRPMVAVRVWSALFQFLPPDGNTV